MQAVVLESHSQLAGAKSPVARGHEMLSLRVQLHVRLLIGDTKRWPKRREGAGVPRTEFNLSQYLSGETARIGTDKA